MNTQNGKIVISGQNLFQMDLVLLSLIPDLKLVNNDLKTISSLFVLSNLKQLEAENLDKVHGYQFPNLKKIATKGEVVFADFPSLKSIFDYQKNKWVSIDKKNYLGYKGGKLIGRKNHTNI